MIMRALVIATIVLASSSAHAELWGSSMGELMKHAKRIEVVAVDTVTAGAIEGHVSDAIRSPFKLGDAVHWELSRVVVPAVGDRSSSSISARAARPWTKVRPARC